MTFSEAALLHAARYPKMTAQDFVKLAYQSARGSEHMLPAPEKVAAYLREEFSQTPQTDGELLTPIGGNLCRLNLSALGSSGLRVETVAGLFRCAKGAGTLEDNLNTLEELAEAGKLTVTKDELAEFLAKYRAMGCPAVHHSQTFRDCYAPAYRIVPAETERLLPLLRRIDALLRKKDFVRVAIDGMCASGKTTLAALLQTVYGANLFHMDDFFLPEARKTPERLAEPGGNVDYERFSEEILARDPDAAFSYRPFFCHPAPAHLGDPVEVQPNRLWITEGAYSLHPALQRAYDLKVFFRIDPALQKARILRRNGEAMLRRFEEEWIPLENAYVEKTGLPRRCDLTLDAFENE